MATDALLTQAIPSLINGVSQQPPSRRLPSQVEVQENMLSDIAVGAVRRPPSEHIALLTGSAAGGAPTGGMYGHIINISPTEQFICLIEDGDINVYDLSDGSEVTVTDNATGIEGSYTYLDINTAGGETARDSFHAVTVADYTFIVNKRVTAAMSGVPDADRENTHEFILQIVDVASVGASTQVNVKINGTNVNSGGTPGDTEALTTAVYSSLTGFNTGTDRIGTTHLDWKFTRNAKSNTIYAYQFQNTGTLQTVETNDEWGDNLHELFASGTGGEPPQASRFSDLPARARDGFTVLVSGEDGSSDDNFWVVYNDDERVWKETVKPGLDNSFDADTMPHALVYNSGAGTFSFEPLTWASRQYGDEDSAPEPSFIGEKITDILVHKNRLSIVAGENVVASEAGEFFNVWPTTVSTIVDSDPFDVAGTGDRVSTWDYALPYRTGLSLFSSVGNGVSELVGSRDETITVKNARIEERGSYAFSPVRPAAVGDSLYFLLDNGIHSSVFQYSEADVGLFRANEITTHVPKYVASDVYKIVAGPAENMLMFICHPNGTSNEVFTYRFHYIGTEQVMSSWSKWIFDSSADILDMGWIESTLYILFERQDGIHLEKVAFGKDDEDEGIGATPLGYRVHLDSLVEVTGSYAAGPDETTWTLPYDQATNGGVYNIVKGGDWGFTRGAEITVADATVDTVIKADGDHSGGAVYIGRREDWLLELSEVVLRESSRSGRNTDTRGLGELQLKSGYVDYVDSSRFNIITQSRTEAAVYADEMQSANFPLALESGNIKFDTPGAARNVRIIFQEAGYYPASIVRYDWDGRFSQRQVQS